MDYKIKEETGGHQVKASRKITAYLDELRGGLQVNITKIKCIKF